MTLAFRALAGILILTSTVIWGRLIYLRQGEPLPPDHYAVTIGLGVILTCSLLVLIQISAEIYLRVRPPEERPRESDDSSDDGSTSR